MSLPINFLIVSLFNRLQQKMGSIKLSLCFLVFVFLINTTFALTITKLPILSIIFYLWKDLYILLVFQQLWSQIHASLGSSSARHFYGMMYMFGALGSICGATLPASLNLNPSWYLFSSAIAYPILFGLQKWLLKNPLHSPLVKKQTAIDPFLGLKKLKENPTLLTIGLLVALMQMVSALSEFIFSKHLEKSFIELADRTKASAAVLSVMHMITLGLQLLFSFITVEKLGLRRGHIMIPSILGAFSLSYLFFPGYSMASCGFIGAKSLDFSLFSVLKESLYAPLDKSAVYESKSFIDVFIYRGAKTVMSLILILFGSLQTSFILGCILFSLIVLWIITASIQLNGFLIDQQLLPMLQKMI